jgi:hypothetical protein
MDPLHSHIYRTFSLAGQIEGNIVQVIWMPSFLYEFNE